MAAGVGGQQYAGFLASPDDRHDTEIELRLHHESPPRPTSTDGVDENNIRRDDRIVLEHVLIVP
jgi:hypothetical protein